METKKVIDIIALVLVIIGGLNWGLFGLFNLDLVNKLFSSVDIVARVVYVLVGVAALWTINLLFNKD